MANATTVSVTAWLLAEDLELVAGTRRWATAFALLVAGAAVVLWGRRAASRDAEFPVRSLVAYAEAADDSTGWLVAPEPYADSGSWNLAALGQEAVRIVPDPSAREARADPVAHPDPGPVILRHGGAVAAPRTRVTDGHAADRFARGGEQER